MAATASLKAQTLVANNNTKNFDPFNVEGQAYVYLQIAVSGASLTGSVKIQHSSDGGTTWIDRASSSQALTSTGGNFYWDILTGAPKTRVVLISGDAHAATGIVTGYAKEG